MIDAMTLAEASEIFAHWAESPPAHLMLQTIAAMIGWKPRQTRGPTVSLSDLADMAPPGLAVFRGAGPVMPAPVFDVAALRALNEARAASLADRAHDESKE